MFHYFKIIFNYYFKIKVCYWGSEGTDEKGVHYAKEPILIKNEENSLFNKEKIIFTDLCIGNLHLLALSEDGRVFTAGKFESNHFFVVYCLFFKKKDATIIINWDIRANIRNSKKHLKC